MKAKDLASELMKNPEVPVCFYIIDPHNVWSEVRAVTCQDNVQYEEDDEHVKVGTVIKLYDRSAMPN